MGLFVSQYRTLTEIWRNEVCHYRCIFPNLLGDTLKKFLFFKNCSKSKKLNSSSIVRAKIWLRSLKYASWQYKGSHFWLFDILPRYGPVSTKNSRKSQNWLFFFAEMGPYFGKKSKIKNLTLRIVEKHISPVRCTISLQCVENHSKNEVFYNLTFLNCLQS